jgi:hypothetical protein
MQLWRLKKSFNTTSYVVTWYSWRRLRFWSTQNWRMSTRVQLWLDYSKLTFAGYGVKFDAFQKEHATSAQLWLRPKKHILTSRTLAHYSVHSTSFYKECLCTTCQVTTVCTLRPFAKWTVQKNTQLNQPLVWSSVVQQSRSRQEQRETAGPSDVTTYQTRML